MRGLRKKHVVKRSSVAVMSKSTKCHADLFPCIRLSASGHADRRKRPALLFARRRSWRIWKHEIFDWLRVVVAKTESGVS